jgi:hypothetical protein
MKNSDFKSLDNYSTKKMDNALKTSLKRIFKIDIDDYIKQEYNIEIKNCAFCHEKSVFDIVYDLKPYKESYMIYISDISYDKLYCYSKNKNCDGRKYNPNSIDFVSKVYSLSDEEALKYIHSRNKSPFYECNHDNKEEYRKYQSIKDRFDGDAGDGDDRYATFIKNLKYSKTINYYIEKYGKDDGERIWYDIQSKKDSMSFKFFLKKNNNDYKKSLIEYKERLKLANVARGYNCFYSKESFILFNDVVKQINLNVESIIFGENEYFIEYYDELLMKNRKYFYDFTDLKNRIIIEYNGLNWHPNKEKMTSEKYDAWYHPFDKTIDRTSLEKKDIHKKKVAEDNNFDVLILWNTETYDYNLNVIYNFYKNKKLI